MNAAYKSCGVTAATMVAFNVAGNIGGEGSFARYAAHATVGCASSVANGGGCGAGAASSVLALAAVGAEVDNNVAYNTTLHVVAGGVGSVIAGGSFGNGAVTGDYGYLYNTLAHAAAGRIALGAGAGINNGRTEAEYNLAIEIDRFFGGIADYFLIFLRAIVLASPQIKQNRVVSVVVLDKHG